MADSFPRFNELPPEIRVMVWEFAEAHEAGTHRNVLVIIRRVPSYRLRALNYNTGWRAPARITYRYTMTSPTRLPITGTVNYEARAEMHRALPNILQLHDQQPIRFDAARDYIMMDYLTLFLLHILDTLPFRWWRVWLRGFFDHRGPVIRHLATPLFREYYGPNVTQHGDLAVFGILEDDVQRRRR